MASWTMLLHLGDLHLTVPAAAAISATLAVLRAPRRALLWAAGFALALFAVGLSKMSYMLSGTGIAALRFKALSGHATGAAAVLPALFYLLVQLARASPAAVRTRARRTGADDWRANWIEGAALMGGLACALLVALALVADRQHSLSEALAGFAVGASVSLGALAAGGPAPLRPPLAGLYWIGVVCALAAWLIHPIPVGYWMIKAARLLAGQRPLHGLSLD